MEIKIFSAQKLTPQEVDAICFIMQNSRNRDRDLANRFPQRFKCREGNTIKLDHGKRRYCEKIKDGGGDDG